VLTFGVSSRNASTVTAPNPLVRHESRIAEQFGRLPLSFEANVGQVDSRVQYLSRGSGHTLFLTEDAEAVVALTAGAERNEHAALRLRFAGGRAHPAVAAERPFPS